VRQALKEGRDPIAAILQETGGWLLFKGEVTARRWEDRSGYHRGEHDLAGIDEFQGHTFRLWFKNENHISWLDDRPFVTSPDILAIVDLESLAPLVTPAIRDGHRLAVIGVRARAPFRTPAGLELLGPRHFGFDLDYAPIEEHVERQR
jgi:DUF917 family protein